MTAHAPAVVAIADAADLSSILPADHPFRPDVYDTASAAAARIAELRARSVPAVVLVARRALNIPATVMEFTRRYPEVPVVVATFEGAGTSVPSRAIGRPAGSPALVSALRDALRAAVQQARVRTTLDRLNVRLATESPPDPRQQRRLVLSGLYLGSILEQARDGIFVTDRDGVVALWNRAAGELFGRTEDEVSGRRIDETLDTAAGPSLLALIRTLSPDRKTAAHGLTVSRSGERRDVEVALTLVFDPQGNAVAVSGIARDVTERNALQQELERRAEALAQTNRHKDEFLAILSHELRTPLNAVLGWAQILAATPDDAERTKRATEMIARNAEIQRRLVEDLLDYARIAAGRMPVRLEPAPLDELVRATVDALRPSIESRQLRLSESYDSNAYASVDRERLGQVISNLVSNAVKFTPPGGAISVRVQRDAEKVRIEVADTGQGIAPDFLPHVFDEFRQADASTSRTGQGLGLGLAIARRIVELHGGEITAWSAGVGRGAVFTVALSSAAAGAS